MTTAVVQQPARKLRAHVRVGGLAFADQVLFGLASFTVNVMLARFVSPAQYGAFALAFFVFLLLGAAHTALLTEPMLVFGASTYETRLRGYLWRVLQLHLATAGLLSAGVAAAAAVLWRFDPGAGKALAALAVVTPFVLLLWLLRRVFYVRFELVWATVADGVYLVATVAGIYAVHKLAHLDAMRAFLVMGGAAAIASGLLLAVLRPRADATTTLREVAGRHWRYGSWSVVAQALFWASGQVMTVLVPVVLGLGKLAALAATINLYRPLNPVLLAASAMLLPATAKAAAAGAPIADMRRRIRRYNVLLGGSVLAYGLVLSVGAKPILHHLYAGRYDGQAGLVLLLALTNTASTVVQVQTVLLKATGHVRTVPLIWGLSAALVLVLSVPAMLLWGLTGAVAVLLASYTVAAVAAVRLTRAMETRPQ